MVFLFAGSFICVFCFCCRDNLIRNLAKVKSAVDVDT